MRAFFFPDTALKILDGMNKKGKVRRGYLVMLTEEEHKLLEKKIKEHGFVINLGEVSK